MSTTFGVRVPLWEEGWDIPGVEFEEIEVAYRSSSIRWVTPLAQLLPDDTKVIPMDNSAQGIYTIGDIKKEIKQQDD